MRVSVLDPSRDATTLGLSTANPDAIIWNVAKVSELLVMTPEDVR